MSTDHIEPVMEPVTEPVTEPVKAVQPPDSVQNPESVQNPDTVHRTPLSVVALKGKRKVGRIIDENLFEEVFIDKESERINKIQAKSSLTTDEILISYTPMISWGKYDLEFVVDVMLKFMPLISGLKLYPYQVEFAERIFKSVLQNDGEELTALYARQSGKSETVAQVCDTLLVLLPILARHYEKELGHFKRGFRIGLFAPTLEQAYTTHQRMDMRLSSENADAILADVDIEATKRYSGGILEIFGSPESLPSGRVIPAYYSYCKVQSTAKQTKIESKTYDLIVVEEAQDADSMKVQKSLHPMLASTNGTIVKVGTPTTFISDFYSAIQRNKRRFSQSKLQNHFEYEYKTVQRYNPKYKAFIQKEKDRLGESADSFRLSYCLEWLIEKGMAITPQMFEEYMQDSASKFEYAAEEDRIYVGGLDLAKEGASTVLTIAKIVGEQMVESEGETEQKYVKQVVNWLEMKGDNWETQFHTIVQLVRVYKLKALTVDSTGLGDPIFDRLEKELEDDDVVLVPVIYTLKSKHELATIFYSEMRSHRVKIPAHSLVKKTVRYKNFLDQFYSCLKIYKGSYMQLKKNEEEKGAADDYVNSLLLLLYGVEQNLLFKIKETNNFLFGHGFSGKMTERSKRYEKAMAQIKRRRTANWRKSN